MGRSADHRGSLANEMFTLMERLWAEESVDFDGKFFQYRNASIAPRPIQQPLPLWIGGSSPAAAKRTARLGSGWIGGAASPADVAGSISMIKAELLNTGRTIDDDHYGAGFYFRFGGWDDGPLPLLVQTYQKRTGRDPKYSFAVGTGPDICARIEEYIAAGISKFVLRPTGSNDEELMDQTQRLIDEVIPAFAGR